MGFQLKNRYTTQDKSVHMLIGQNYANFSA